MYLQVEVLKPIPHVKKIKETRYTTIRYPVFITQVIKPLLTQVETKVKPVFFTKTINKYTTVLFTVTGIGQVTVTSVKYEKEYITRCMKKGYGHGHGHHKGGGGYGHHRREFEEVGPLLKEDDIQLPLASPFPGQPTAIAPPHGIPYDDIYEPYPSERIKDILPPHLKPGPSPPIPGGERVLPPVPFPRDQRRRPAVGPPRSPIGHLMRPFRRNVNRSGVADTFAGTIGDVSDLYSSDIFYLGPVGRQGRVAEIILEASSMPQESKQDSITVVHPKLEKQPLLIVT